MSQNQNNPEFITLLEFCLQNRLYRNHILLRDPLCEKILLQKKSEPTSTIHSSPLSLFPMQWKLIMKSSIYEKLLHEFPIDFYKLLADYHIFFKTPSCLLVRLSHVNYACYWQMGGKKHGSMEITRQNLLCGQSNEPNTNIGGKLEKLKRLKDDKKNNYILKLLSHSQEYIKSEDEIKILSQVLNDLAKHIRKLNPSVLLPAKCNRNISTENQAKNLEKLGQACILDNADICRFISSLIITTIPLKSVFGNCKLRRIFIRELLKLIRNCPMYDSRFLEKLEFHSVENSALRVFSERPQVISNILYFIITEVLFPLVKNQFYIARVKRDLVFYNKSLWFKLQDDGFKQMSSYFSEVEHEFVDWLQLSKQLFGIYTIRIQPKTSSNSFRLISLLNKSAICKVKFNMPVNAVLVPTAAILNSFCKDSECLYKPQPIKGKVDLRKKISAFKSRLSRQCSGELPKLYFFKCDAKSCYDNIPLEKLLTDVLNWLNWSPFFHLLKIRKYCHLTYRTYTENIAIPSKQNETLSFEEIMKVLVRKFKSCTLTLMKYKVYSKEFAKRNVQLFLKFSIMYHDGRFYRRMLGIPQGAKISKLLCDFYFRYIFRDVYVGTDSLFLSATDDFLFISQHKSEVDKFMNDCFSGKYDFILNKQKTESYQNHKEEFLYYGVKINLSRH